MRNLERNPQSSLSPPVNGLLVTHGVHPGERNMRKLHDHMVKQELVDGLRQIVLSPEDWELNRRLFEGKENLNFITPNEFGSRGQRLLATYCLFAKNYDFVFNPHGTSLPDTDIAVYGAKAEPLVKQVASYLNLSKAIIRTKGIEAALPNCLGAEIGVNSPMLNLDMLYERIASLLLPGTELPQTPVIDEYILVATALTKTANTLNLKKQYESFERLTPHDTQALHQVLGSNALELFAYAWDGHAYDTTGFRGELVTPYPLPPSHPLSKHEEVTI